MGELSDRLGHVTAERLRALLVDCDGTLADTESVVRKTWADVRGAFGCDGLTHKHDLSDPHPMSLAKSVRAICSMADAASTDQVTNFILRKFDENMLDIRIYHDVVATLSDAIRQGLGVAVVSNSSREHVCQVLALAQVDTNAIVIVANEDVELRKPHPHPYLKALNELKVHGGAAVAVEDSDAGIESALSAGIWTVGLTNDVNGELARGSVFVPARPISLGQLKMGHAAFQRSKEKE